MSRTSRILRAALLFPSIALVLACGTEGDDDPSGPSPDQAEHAEAMAREHAGDDARPSPAAEAPAAAPVESRQVVYANLDGRAVEGYLAVPEGVENPPGLVVIHEWWGLNDNIRQMADRLAGEGYAALAVDLYEGRSASEPEQARQIMQSAMEDEARIRENLRAAHDYLTSELGSPRTGVLGWCFGGGWSLQTALAIPALDAAVIYYGRVETSRETLQKLETPLLGHFGGEDQGIPIESVRELESTLAELEKNATIHVYEGAGHAFANPSGSRYEADAAETAWERTLEFLAEHLKRPAEAR